MTGKVAFMPTGPTTRMRALASRRLVDVVTVAGPVVVPTSRADLAGAPTFAAGVRYRAAVQTVTVQSSESVTVDRVVGDLSVWVDDPAGTITAGDRVTFTRTRDLSLTGQTGTVLTVTRDSLQAVRRLVVRLGNVA